MMKPRIRVVSVAVMILIMVLLPSLHSPAQIANAQGGADYLDETGKIGGIFLRPGVRDEFKSSVDVAWSHTLDTLRGAQGGEAQRDQILNCYQDYAILASSLDSIGDLQFDFWIVEAVSDIRIYMPSNFTFGYDSRGYGERAGGQLGLLGPTGLGSNHHLWPDANRSRHLRRSDRLRRRCRWKLELGRCRPRSHHGPHLCNCPRGWRSPHLRQPRAPRSSRSRP